MYDVVVIGSGAGGLTAAVALANAGKRVLVLEQHYLPGGWCQTFQRKGYQYSPGVHYIGQLEPDDQMDLVYRGLGISQDLEFYRLNPEGYDHIQVGDEFFDFPAGARRREEALKERFPEERAGIERFCRGLQLVGQQAVDNVFRLEGWRYLQLPFRAPSLVFRGSRRLEATLDATVKHPLLRTILAAQGGTYGLPPAQTSQLMHGIIWRHYSEGGYYPRGGAKALPEALIARLKRQGGEVRLRSRVRQIVIERGRVVGVELESGERIKAPVVVSNADPHVTLMELVGQKHLNSRTIRRLQRTEFSVSCVSVFLATDLDLPALGYDSGNYWYYARPDLNGIYARVENGLPDEPEFLFLTIPTLKDPEIRGDAVHTIEIFGLAPYSAFEAWEEQPLGRRAQEYLELKERLATQFIRAAERIIPGLSQHLLYSEAASPLTNAHFCGAYRGAMYGTAKTRNEIADRAFPQYIGIPGLYMVGASTFLHGVMGATLSGLLGAAKVLQCAPEALLKEQGPPCRIHESC